MTGIVVFRVLDVGAALALSLEVGGFEIQRVSEDAFVFYLNLLRKSNSNP